MAGAWDAQGQFTVYIPGQAAMELGRLLLVCALNFCIRTVKWTGYDSHADMAF